MVFLASHVGNWELMAATGTLIGGVDVMLVTKHLKPEWLHVAIESGRRSCGVDATYEPRTMRDILARLKAGLTVGFVLDQYTGPPVGARVPVFGQPVGTSMALATFVKRSGAAVLPVVNYRVFERGRIHWRVEIRAPLEWEASPDGPEADLAHNTARYAAQVERDILAHPEQWLWIHRRFKGDLAPLRPGEWQEGRARK
jgi:KDO2-lipid IV(A) lauroyltransferase